MSLQITAAATNQEQPPHGHSLVDHQSLAVYLCNSIHNNCAQCIQQIFFFFHSQSGKHTNTTSWLWDTTSKWSPFLPSPASPLLCKCLSVFPGKNASGAMKETGASFASLAFQLQYGQYEAVDRLFILILFHIASIAIMFTTDYFFLDVSVFRELPYCRIPILYKILRW